MAFGVKSCTVISIVSPKGVLLWDSSIDSSPLTDAPVMLAIMPVLTVIFKSNLDHTGLGCGLMKFRNSTVSSFSSKISSVLIVRVNGCGVTLFCPLVSSENEFFLAL